ncbi:DUF3854 domain-containing protein (plasmid) [Rubrobacter tropicus]|uniref:DUF3854 domain-containing protein n=1 Tax=Rubrobacter tropicus TaxID=2653851 RepID=A0A6G8QFQ9_9ACTN|nr:DUF3854 domain-containing protein [Rubrobacter tropicus]QIN85335.1 DUF3854 domain-containing protein [Rubrobacter tropicus]
MTTERGGAGRRPHRDNRYDTDLINGEALAVCDHYLSDRRREGRRYVYVCPDCGKADFEVEPVKGLAGCFNPGCPMPRTTNALGIVSHMEGLEPQGVDFVRCLEKAYEILGLTMTPPSARPADAGRPENGTRSWEREDGAAVAAPEPNGSYDVQVPREDDPGGETFVEDLHPPRGRRWVRQNGEGEDHEGAPVRPAPRGERVYPIEAYFEGPDGEQIPTEAVIVDEGPEIAELPAAVVSPGGPAAEYPPEEAELADERELRHAVYERLLALCPLEERDADFFEGRGLDRRTIDEGGFGSISCRRSRWVAERLRELFGDEDLLTVPGFYRPERAPDRIRFSLYGDYALIPYHDAEGFITTVEGRLIGEPKNSRDKKYKALLGSGVHLYVHPRFGPGEVVAFCEGAIGAMVAARYGVPMAAIKGFRNYKVSAREPGADRVLPELEGVDFAGREVVYIPDVDVKPQSRAEVMEAVPAACEWLVRRQGGVPKVALLPMGAKDLDEWLLSLPESERTAQAGELLADAVDLGAWISSLEGFPEEDHPVEDVKPAADTAPEARAAGTARTTPPAGGKRDLLGDDDATPAAGLFVDRPSASEMEPQGNDGADTRELRWDGGRVGPGRAERPNGSHGGAAPATHDPERARKGPMHPAMARWYDVARYTPEQVADARQQTAIRKVAGNRRPTVRDTPVTLPRWTPGEVLLALAVALATAVGLCLLAYAMRAGGGALGVAGALITWPFWWLEAALYAWAGALAALWVVGRRHRARDRQLRAHLQREE